MPSDIVSDSSDCLLMNIYRPSYVAVLMNTCTHERLFQISFYFWNFVTVVIVINYITTLLWVAIFILLNKKALPVPAWFMILQFILSD